MILKQAGQFMADGLKGFLARLSTDDPETNGPRLWVMFAISLFLVATLNWYAMVREPSIVDVDELTDYINEVVKVCLLYTSPSPRD